MTIKQELVISTLIQMTLIGLATVFLIIASNIIQRSNEKVDQATQITKTITEIRFVTFEYLLSHNKRSFEQWQLAHDKLGKLLENRDTSRPIERETLDIVAANSRDIDTIFNRLMNLYSNPDSTQDTATREALEERLATQLLVKQQSQISNADKFSSAERANAERWHQRADWLTGGALLLVLSITAFNIIFITRNITKNLAKLQQGATKLAAGDLSYRMPASNSTTEFGQITATFNSMAASLEQTDKVRSEFILIASHQLRTPLTTLKWYTEELLSPADEIDSDTQKEYIQQIHESNERMIRLVDQLLTASKIGFGSLPVKSQMVKIKAVLQNVLRDISAQRRHKNITISKDISAALPEVWIDPTWLHVILQNLLSNAVKYSKHGQQISLSAQTNRAGVLITVADHGCGIPEAQKNKIFTRLFRADNAREAEGEGSGLGLYISKAMIEQAGGKIWFESQENQGTTFFIYLRTKQPPAK